MFTLEKKQLVVAGIVAVIFAIAAAVVTFKVHQSNKTN
jgi:hypothetical protein